MNAHFTPWTGEENQVMALHRGQSLVRYRNPRWPPHVVPYVAMRGDRRENQGGKSKKKKGSKKKSRNPDWFGTEESETIPLNELGFLDASGAIQWDVLEHTERQQMQRQKQDYVFENTTLVSSTKRNVKAAERRDAQMPGYLSDEELCGTEQDGLVLTRAMLTSGGRYLRSTTLGAIDAVTRDENVEDLGDATRIARQMEPVRVALVVTPERGGDAYVQGHVRTVFRNQPCDRCTIHVEQTIRSSFETWLAARADTVPNTDASDPRIEESIEPFHEGIETIDFAKHVRDAIYLGMPMRIICRDTLACGRRMERLGWAVETTAKEDTLWEESSNKQGFVFLDGKMPTNDDRAIPFDPNELDSATASHGEGTLDGIEMQSLAQNPEAIAALKALRDSLYDK